VPAGVGVLSGGRVGRAAPVTLLVVAALVVVGLLAAGCTTPGSSPAMVPIPPPRKASRTTVAPRHRTTAPKTVSAKCLPALKGSLERAEQAAAVKLVRQSHAYQVVTCRYRVMFPRRHICRRVKATVNREAQPFTDFSRWEVEASQEVTQGGRHATDLRPQPVSGIGLAADWVPALQELEAANQRRWVTVTLTCPAFSTNLVLAKRLMKVAIHAPLV
jgi:hypothetical protein